MLIADVVLRDGLQDEPIIVAAEDRVRLGRLLLGAGLGSLEVGAFMSTRMVPQMAGTDAVLDILARDATAALHTLVRFFHREGVHTGIEPVKQRPATCSPRWSVIGCAPRCPICRSPRWASA